MSKDPFHSVNSKLSLRTSISLDHLEPGDHACYFYRNRGEQLRTASKFIAYGLKKDEKCLYILGDRSSQEIQEAMENEGISVEAAKAKGQLAILSKDVTYLRNGVFSAKEMLEYGKQLSLESKRAGAPALRVTGELTWTAEYPVSVSDLIEYELQVDCFFLAERPRIIALCQYDITRLSPEMALGARVSHRHFLEV